MGGKPRRKPDLVALAKELQTLQATVARQQVIATDAAEALAASKAALADTRNALLAAAKSEKVTTSSAAPAPARSAKTGKRRRAKPRTATYWKTIQNGLIKAMRKGTTYDSAELQKLAGCEREPKHRFAANVRKPLIAAKKVKKTIAKKGNRSPRNVRWVLV